MLWRFAIFGSGDFRHSASPVFDGIRRTKFPLSCIFAHITIHTVVMIFSAVAGFHYWLVDALVGLFER